MCDLQRKTRWWRPLKDSGSLAGSLFVIGIESFDERELLFGEFDGWLSLEEGTLWQLAVGGHHLHLE